MIAPAESKSRGEELKPRDFDMASITDIEGVSALLEHHSSLVRALSVVRIEVQLPGVWIVVPLGRCIESFQFA